MQVFDTFFVPTTNQNNAIPLGKKWGGLASHQYTMKFLNIKWKKNHFRHNIFVFVKKSTATHNYWNINHFRFRPTNEYLHKYFIQKISFAFFVKHVTESVQKHDKNHTNCLLLVLIWFFVILILVRLLCWHVTQC